jgi:hypothetical protein
MKMRGATYLLAPARSNQRPLAFDGMLVTLTFGLSSVLCGGLADAVGAPITALTMGGVAAAWAASWSWLTTDVRRVTLLEGCGGPPESEYLPCVPLGVVSEGG